MACFRIEMQVAALENRLSRQQGSFTFAEHIMKSINFWRHFLLKHGKQAVFVPVDLVRHAIFHNLRTEHHHVLLACMPKSGSTYLSAILGNLPDFERIALIPGYSRREQELDTALLLLNNRTNYVAQHHVRYSEVTGMWLRDFGISPVVLIRNIFDIVISLKDHVRKESHEASMAYIRPEMADWDDSRLEDFIVRMVIPWYFNFYLSWMDCPEKEVVTYEELTTNPADVLARIGDRFGLGFPVSQIDKAIQYSNQNSGLTRLNKGVSGRGKDLSEKARAEIYAMASFYEGVDFSAIGIPPR